MVTTSSPIVDRFRHYRCFSRPIRAAPDPPDPAARINKSLQATTSRTPAACTGRGFFLWRPPCFFAAARILPVCVSRQPHCSFNPRLSGQGWNSNCYGLLVVAPTANIGAAVEQPWLFFVASAIAFAVISALMRKVTGDDGHNLHLGRHRRYLGALHRRDRPRGSSVHRRKCDCGMARATRRTEQFVADRLRSISPSRSRYDQPP
jgi:hypothetical protein